MAKNLKGVGGVLGSLISPEPAASSPPEPATNSESAAPTAPPAEPVTPAVSAPAATTVKPRPSNQTRIPARRGRPPGKRAGEAAEKEKVTLRLSKDLMDEYRDWSWEERCQLGELVERALTQYRKHRSRQQSQ